MADLTFTNDGLTFEASEWGPSGGDLVVLLHGFPENRTSWRDVAPPLAEAGCHVVAPDQRGYSPAARPSRRRDYALSRLVGDVVALADHLGAPRFHLVGHDWGGAVAWATASAHADRLASLSVLSTPHPRAMASSMLRSSQIAKSWYMLLFQLPALPEAAMTAGGGDRFRASLVRSGLPEPYAGDYVAMLRGGAARYALHWYRAIPFGDPRANVPVSTPTLYVYSTGDMALTRTAADLTQQHVTGPYRYEVIPGSHWIPEEQPDVVARLVLDHVRAHPV